MNPLKLSQLPQNLQDQIQNIIKICPESKQTFKSLIQHFEKEQQGDKKRKKADNISSDTNEQTVNTLAGSNIMLQLPELSIQSPFRKRLNLVFGAFKGEKKAYLALTKETNSKPELIIKTLTSDNIKFAAILNVPEKKSLRYLLIEYNENDGNLFKNDPVLIQFNNDTLQEQFGTILGNKTFVQYLTSQLSLVDFKIQDYTSTEDTFFVQCYKGNKEGFLYFLPNHVIFGFKKPILFFDSMNIESITYNSITRLTFNVLFEVKINGITEKFEFSMIDQKEFENIDSFVKTKDVRDKSMADEQKAQRQLKNNNEPPSDLADAAKLVPGGDQLINNANIENADDDDDEDDDNYQIGDSDDDHSDISERDHDFIGGDNNDNDDNDANDNGNDNNISKDGEDYVDYGNTAGYATSTGTLIPGTLESIDSLGAFDDNLQQELQDLQKDLDIDINELQKAGYINM